MRRYLWGLAAAAAVTAGAEAGRAGAVPFEEAVLGTARVTLYLHPFLTAEELATLRLVMTNEQALAIFVPQDKAAEGGFAAMAAAPGDGFVRDGKPAASATALAGFADSASAEAAAVQACDALRTGEPPCVVVLKVAPAE